MQSELRPRSISAASVPRALAAGWQIFRACTGVSMAYAAIFAVIGVLLLWGVARIGLAPLAWSLAGGFLLVGPVVLAGFLSLSAAVRAGRKPGWGDVIHGYRQVPRGLVGLSAVCVLLYIIWMTDAGILYSFMVGDTGAGWRMMLPVSEELLRFQLGAWFMGSVFALIVFCISAYSVPLLVERRAALVAGVAASVKAVFGSPVASLVWALVLGAAVIVAIVLPPVLTVILPVLAFAGEALYREVFPG
ncbi:MAG TPA: DUF2189 domain-containing protein [Azoarcus taiwanensis]|nr:DUF2189 domain-containing protein [Azoarcus taiwanensis]